MSTTKNETPLSILAQNQYRLLEMTYYGEGQTQGDLWAAIGAGMTYVDGWMSVDRWSVNNVGNYRTFSAMDYQQFIHVVPVVKHWEFV